MIETYKFGNIVVDGTSYTKDIIILPNGKVICPWWRNSGHILELSDLCEILSEPPGHLVIGTGNSGQMKPVHGLVDTLEQKSINIIILPTQHAMKKYNSLCGASLSVAACFHLTC